MVGAGTSPAPSTALELEHGTTTEKGTATMDTALLTTAIVMSVAGWMAGAAIAVRTVYAIVTGR